MGLVAIEPGMHFDCPKCALRLATARRALHYGDIISTSAVDSVWGPGDIFRCPGCGTLVGKDIIIAESWKP